MSKPAPLLDREGIEEAFRRLGARLAKRGVVADIYVFGGAAMALAYDSRRATRDVDALFKPHGIVLEEARAVAAGSVSALSPMAPPDGVARPAYAGYVARMADARKSATQPASYVSRPTRPSGRAA